MNPSDLSTSSSGSSVGESSRGSLTSQSHNAAVELTKGISSGQFRPGEKLNEVDIAAQLGVSRNTLREGFATLAAQGLVERIPHRGVFITQPTLTQMLDLYTARIILEPGSLLWGSRVGLDGLDGIVRQAEAARDEQGGNSSEVDIQLISDANHDFHRAIVASACSQHLETAMSRILAQMRLAFMHATEIDPAFHVHFITENRIVADLVAEEKYEEAAQKLSESLSRTRDYLPQFFTG
ncbi:GntR family transcriptional regulator [Corynebacterium dentalis]|uniref:GntR family transcriptional regulator n=1 Tax=Corynebacterium dentalis TaxID=2014528 RepID=UPI00289F3F79|nr:GntR family transcriptional regulator [Corynebacterium dentalis]